MKQMTQEELKKLREMLPYGYSSKLQKIIKKKHKKTLALITIRKGLMPKHANEMVIDAAFTYITQVNEEQESRSKIMKALD